MSRAVYTELVSSQKIEGFIRGFKPFVARRERPNGVYSDNGKTFKASELIHDYFTVDHIAWKLHLSRAQWWGEGSV